MIFGSCTMDPSKLKFFEKYGYGVFESIFQLVLKMSDEEYDAFARELAKSKVRMAGTNCFAPPEMRLLALPEAEVDAYFESGLKRLKPLGLEYFVFGSGGARKPPEGMPLDEARARLVEMLRRFGDIAERYDVDVYFEPLRTKETTMINTVEEGAALCREVAHPRVGLLADFYHMSEMGTPFSVLRDCVDCLRHIHVATADRRIPLVADKAEVEAMAAVLNEIGYHGRVVLETFTEPDADVALGEFSTFFAMFKG